MKYYLQKKSLNKILFEGKSTFNLLCYLLWGLSLFDYLVGAFRHFVPSITNNNYITIPVIFICVFFALPDIIKRLHVRDLIIYIFCICIYIMQYILYPNNITPLNEYAFLCCLAVFPFYLFGKMVDLPKMLNAFYYISVGTIVMYILYFLLYRNGSGQLNSEEYNMAAAYNLLPHVLMVVWMAIRKFSPTRIGMAFISIIVLFMFGTRGPILSLAVPVSIYILFRYHGKHTKLIKTLFITLVVVLPFVLVPIITYFQDVFSDLDVSARILDKLLDEDITNDSGRGDLIVELNKHLLTEHKICGYGLFGSYQFIGGYPHNIFYELIFSFGFLIGGMLIVWMLWHFFKGYHYASNDIYKDFILLFTLMELTHLCFSYTFLTEQMFFMLIGLCAQSSRQTAKNLQISNINTCTA